MNDHVRSVFIFAFTARTRGLIDTDEKQNMCRLLVEIWGKANWDKRWQGSIFNELASKSARNGPRHSIIESITWTAYSCAFKGCFCLRERNSNTFPYHTSFSSLRMYRNFFFCKYQKLRARDCIFKSKICSENNEKVARPILYYCCAHGLFKKNTGSGFDLGDNFCLTWNICFLSYGNILDKYRFDPSVKW